MTRGKTLAGATGVVEYTGRAFHQDAQEAMGGDIVRALIELMTNSDDAYDATDESATGKINIEIDRSRGRDWTAVVRDRAIGMSAAQMVERITRLGGRTSGFESGLNRRGNLGRGAKDVAAFGEVRFESVRDGRYASLVLRSDGTYSLDHDHPATSDERAQLGIPRGNGTVVTIRVQAGVKCPLHQTLKKKLSSHYQLRDILSDATRRVELHTINSGARDRLVYQYPQAPVVFDGDVTVEGYPEGKARLTIVRNAARYDEGRDDPTRVSGILIKGRRAIYDNTLFGFEGNPQAGWFSGSLVCPFIDVLARQYDDRLGEENAADLRNPIPIISRRRDGIAPNHPFAKALRAAAEQPLGALIAAEEERAKREGSPLEDRESRAALDKLGREISRFINDEFRELEAEEEGKAGEGSAPPIALVPEFAFAYLGEDRTLTVQVRGDLAEPGDFVTASTDPAGVVEVLTAQVQLSTHPRRADLLSGQLRLRPLVQDSTLVTVAVGEHAAEAMVEVREPRIIEEETSVPPEALEFERSSYRVGLHAEKTVELRAPSHVIAAVGRNARVSSSVPGVVVRTPALELQLDENRDFWIGAVTLEGRGVGATALITALIEDVSASAHVSVVRKEEGPTFKIRVVDEDMGPFRGVEARETDPNSGAQVRVIKVSGRHPALIDLLRDSGLRSREARLVVAEVVTDTAARLVVSQLYRQKRGLEDFPADRFYREHYRRVLRLLPRAQATLLADLAQPSGLVEG